MPAFPRSGGEWRESVPRARHAGAWTGDFDNLYARQGGQWVLIYPDPAAVEGGLLPPENLTVDFVDEFSVEVSWTNPVQPNDDPTEIHVRIVEHGDVWFVDDYPFTTFSHGALNADSDYQLQVRYAIRVNGEITAYSAPASVFFTTDPAIVGNPAPDPGGTGGDSIIPIGPPPGGTPGPVGGDDVCWWAWELFIISQTTLAWITTGITGTHAGNDSTFEYDLATLDPTRVYRFEFCEVCDGVETGNCHFGEPFNGLGDWGADCGDIPASSSAGLASVADAIWAMPEICIDGDGQGIFDRVSGTRLIEGPHFRAWFTDADGEQGVICDDDGGQVWSVGLAAVGTTLIAGQDFTIMKGWRNPDLLPEEGEFAEDTYGMSHVLRRVITATGWRYKAVFYGENGQIVLEGTEHAFDTEWHTVIIRWDDDGDKELIVDGTIEDTDSSGDSIDDAMLIVSGYVAGLPGGAQTRMHIGWDRVLTDNEIGELNGACEAATILFADPFDRADSATLGANWTPDTTPWAITGNTAQLTGTGLASIERAALDMPSPDHWSEGDISPPSTNPWVTAVIARYDSGTGNHYAVWKDGSNGLIKLARGNDPSAYTTITSVADTSPGATNTSPITARLELVGTQIRVWQYYSGTWNLKIDTTDSTYTVGNEVGIAGYRLTGTSIVNNFKCGIGQLECSVGWVNYWDFSNTALYTGAVATGQLPDVGTLAMKAIDVVNGMAISTINGLAAAANTGGFLSGRGEWGTDGSLPAFSQPFGIGCVYQIIVGTGAASGGVMALATHDTPSGSVKPSMTGSGSGGTRSATGVNTITDPGAGDNNAHVMFLYVNDPDSELWVDGELVASGDLAVSASIAANARVIAIGGRSADGGGPAGGAATVGYKWGEGGLMVGTLDADHLAAWFEAVMAKWGVA